MVAVGECLDPGFVRAIGLEIQHAGQSSPIVGPATAVFDEVLCLRNGAGGGTAMGEVVAAAEEAGFGCIGVVPRELGIFVGGALGCFDIDEPQPAIFVGCVEVDVWLIVRDVEALDFGSLAELCRNSRC